MEKEIKAAQIIKNIKTITLPHDASICKPFLEPLDGNTPNVYSLVVPYINCVSYITNDTKAYSQTYKKFYPSAPPPLHLNKDELYTCVKNSKEEFFSGFKENKEGALVLIDKEIAEITKNIILQILKKFTLSLFSSNMVGISIPAKIHESRSILEKCVDLWRFSHIYLTKASHITDHLERLKLIITNCIAGIICSLTKLQSFNPTLGETFQATLQDGTQFYAEQTCHHPAVSSMMLVGPKNCYVAWVSYQIEAKFSGNSAEVLSHSDVYIRFKDGHLIKYNVMPRAKMVGIMMGERNFYFKGPMEFHDITDNVKATLFFDYGEKAKLTGSAKTVRKSDFEGIIYKPKPKSILPKDARSVNDMDNIETEIARINGNWLEKVDINGVNYWTIEKTKPSALKFPDQPLYSDSRYREDLIWHKRKNMENSEKWKDAIEIRQRQDRNIRTQFSSK